MEEGGTKGEILDDFTRMKYLNQANSQPQKVDLRLPGAGEERREWGRFLFHGYRVSM